MQSICFLDPFISDASYVMSLIVLKLNSKLNCRCCVQQVTLYDCVWFSSPSIPSSALSAGYSEKKRQYRAYYNGCRRRMFDRLVM